MTASLMDGKTLAATVRDRFGAGSIVTALTYQRMAAAFAPADAARALNYAHSVTTTPETSLVKVDTLVDIAAPIPPLEPGPRLQFRRNTRQPADLDLKG